MEKSTNLGYCTPHARKWGAIFSFWIKTFLTIVLASLLSLQAISQTIDFHQARNHFQNTYAIDWVGGILNATHTEYFEGVGIAQRIILTAIPSKLNNEHTIQFKVLAQKSGAHAYDFLMSWEQAWETARDIGNGSTNELLSLASESGGVVTINNTTAWGSAISADALAASSTLTNTRRAILQDNLTSILGDAVQPRIECFETVYGERALTDMIRNTHFIPSTGHPHLQLWPFVLQAIRL
jgi:hypothetical protein